MLSTTSFHLQWNNHLANLRTLLEILYNEQAFIDVTISCSDGSIGAHKLVLSACSRYFDAIFRANPSKHPTIILRGISLKEIQLLMEYMYIGSVDIPENELENLLQIANELHVKGLVHDTVDEDCISDKNEEPTNIEHNPEIKSENEMKESFAVTNYNLKNSNEEKSILKQVMSTENQISTDNTNKSDCKIINYNQMNVEECTEENFKIRTADHNLKFENADNQNCYSPDLFCMLCKKNFLTKQNMKRHMQTHTGVKPHQCTLCNLSFLRLSHLQRHYRVHTGEKPFQCNQCDRLFSRSDKLKQHIAQNHSGIIIPKQAKQRGRPRKAVPLNVALNFSSSPNQKLPSENVENTNNVPSYHTLQQIYNIPSNLSGISAIQ